MKRRLVAFVIPFLVTVCLVMLGGCQSATYQASDDTVITLERTVCFGFCPVYTLTVKGDGTVVYEGKDFVERVGIIESEISQDKIVRLVAEFEKADFFSLNDSYTERTITDAPTVITTITIDGRTKIIEHYHGDFSAPETLSELEDRIDRIVNSGQWIK